MKKVAFLQSFYKKLNSILLLLEKSADIMHIVKTILLHTYEEQYKCCKYVSWHHETIAKRNEENENEKKNGYRPSLCKYDAFQ